MTETFFTVPEELRDRVAELYVATPDGFRPAGAMAGRRLSPRAGRPAVPV